MVAESANLSWKAISEKIGVSEKETQDRYLKLIKLVDSKARNWSPEEDARLIEFVEKYGDKKWSKCENEFLGRTGKQCRQRYKFFLDPKINKKAWTDSEDQIMMKLFDIHGSKWSMMKESLPGRTTN